LVLQSEFLQKTCERHSCRIQLESDKHIPTHELRFGVPVWACPAAPQRWSPLPDQLGITQMSVSRLLSVIALLAVTAAPALAQSVQAPKPATPPTAVTAPTKPTAPTVAAPVVRKINLNTATSSELDSLPQIGPARAKAIVDARAKGKFKNWDDFVARKVVPSNAEAAIKDMVGF
jgi:competence protein ComEA